MKRSFGSDKRKNSTALFPSNWRAIVGFHAIREALVTRSKGFESIWFQEGWESRQELRKLAAEFKSKIPKVEVKPEATLAKIAASHQGAVLFSSNTPSVDWEKIANLKKCKILLLDGIEDPHNLGAILRTCWLTDVSAVIIPQDHAVGLSPIVHKVASGGVEHVPISIESNFTNILEDLKKNGFWVYGLSHESKTSIFNLKLPEKVVWCLGSEDKGLRTTTSRLVDDLVSIPQANAAASYNVSVAAAISLLETVRQHQN